MTGDPVDRIARTSPVAPIVVGLIVAVALAALNYWLSPVNNAPFAIVLGAAFGVAVAAKGVQLRRNDTKLANRD